MSGWPWPMNAVQGWFDGLWNFIPTAVETGVRVVHDWVTDGVNWLFRQVQNIGKWIVDSAKSFFNTVRAAVTNLGNTVQGWISSGINTLWKIVSDTGAWLYNSISTFFSTLQAAVTRVASDLGGAISGGISSVVQGLQNLGGSITTTLGGLFEGAHKWITDGLTWLKDGVVNTGAHIINSVGGAVTGAFEALASGVTSVFEPILKGIEKVFNILGSLFTEFDPAQLVTDTVATLQSLMAAITVAFSSKSPRTPDEAYNITWQTIDQVSAAYMTQTVALIIAEAASVGQLDISTQGLVHTPQMDAALNTVSQLYNIMAEVSLYIPLRQYFNRAFTPEIPPVPDLIRFVVREVITPERFNELMPLHGFSAEFAANYWAAHWVLPSYGNLADAFHRDVITGGELDKFIVWHDYSPEPRPGISKSDVEILRGILKTLIPRVDIRYAWEMGIIDDAGLVARYRALGYEDDAELMAEIQKVRALTEEIHKVRDQWIADFVDGFILEDTLRANLEAIGIGPARIDYYVAYAVKRRDRNQVKELLDIYQDGYLKDLVTEEELAEYATELLKDPEAIRLFLDRAHVRKYKKPSPPTVETVKLATLATLAALYRQDVLAETAFRAELERRRYASDQIDLIVKAEDLKKAAAAAGAD